MVAYEIAPALETLRSQFNSARPNRSKVSDGGIGDAAHASRSSDHNPWVVLRGKNWVTARDYTHDPAHGMDIDQITDQLVASRDPRIKYIIANGLIWEWSGWKRYTGTNPHNKHFHLSVVSDVRCLDGRSWNLTMFGTQTGGGGAAPASPAAPTTTEEPLLNNIQCEAGEYVHKDIVTIGGTWLTFMASFGQVIHVRAVLFYGEPENGNPKGTGGGYTGEFRTPQEIWHVPENRPWSLSIPPGTKGATVLYDAEHPFALGVSDRV